MHVSAMHEVVELFELVLRSAHFSKVFKRTYGVSPELFVRDQLHRGAALSPISKRKR